MFSYSDARLIYLIRSRIGIYESIKKVGITEGKLNIFAITKTFEIEKVKSIKGLTVFAKPGATNILVVDSLNRFNNSRIYFKGSDSLVVFKRSKYLVNDLMVDIVNNSIFYADQNFSCGGAEFRLREDLNIFIGSDCMMSSKITFWTSDGHAILDEDGSCVNNGRDILVMDHVWIGHGVKIQKNSYINNGSIIAGNAVVTRGFDEENVAIAGMPAKVIKKNVIWNRRPPLEFKAKNEFVDEDMNFVNSLLSLDS